MVLIKSVNGKNYVIHDTVMNTLENRVTYGLIEFSKNGGMKEIAKIEESRGSYENMIEDLKNDKFHPFGEKSTGKEKNILENNDLLLFLIETNTEVHQQIVHALDFVSMRKANQGSSLGRYVYRKTKKDVVEFKRIKPYEALIDKKVMEFAINHIKELWAEFNGTPEDLKKYLHLCNTGR